MPMVRNSTLFTIKAGMNENDLEQCSNNFLKHFFMTRGYPERPCNVMRWNNKSSIMSNSFDVFLGSSHSMSNAEPIVNYMNNRPERTTKSINELWCFFNQFFKEP